MRWFCCAATMLREGLLLGAQALRKTVGQGGPGCQPTLSNFSCPRMLSDMAPQTAMISRKQGNAVSGSRLDSSQTLSKLLALAMTDAGVYKEPRKTLLWLWSSQRKLTLNGPTFEGTEPCPQEPQYSGQPQYQDMAVVAATLSPNPGGILR